MKKLLSALLVTTFLFAGINNVHAQKAPLSDSAKAAKKAARAEKKAAKAQAAAATTTTTTTPPVTTPAVKPATVTPLATTTAPAAAKAKTVTQGANKTADKAVGTDAKGRTIYEGSKGGRYTLTAAGNKEYIKKTN